jgi:TolB-like protein/class 3 adenylate cyclase
VRPPELRLRLAAILAADAVAYSRLMSADARATIEALETARRTFQTISVAHGGRVIDTAGDSVLAIFKTAAGAIAAALAIQDELEAGPRPRRRSAAALSHRAAPRRRGAEADGSVYGDGVNVAARLQSAAPAGGIVASESMRLAVRGKLAADFEDLGEHALKNIAEPVRAHRVVAGGTGSVAPPGPAAAAAADAPADAPGGDGCSPGAASCSSRTAVTVSALALAGYAFFHKRPAPLDEAGAGGAAPAPLSILVLPFANQTGDEKKAYIADAFTMSITADLSRIRDVFVVPAATASTYRSKGLTVQQVAKDAAVRFVLAGSVLASGEDVRVTAQLMDSRSGAQLWNETFEGDLSNLFALQDQVTARVGNSIGERMLVVAARESETRRSAPQVVDLMLRARALGYRPHSIENFRERERLYREALAQEPNNVNAMIDLAGTLAIHSSGWTRRTGP